MDMHHFVIHVGPNSQTLHEAYHASLPISVQKIEQYIVNDLAPKSVYQELLVDNQHTHKFNKTWNLSLIIANNQEYSMSNLSNEKLKNMIQQQIKNSKKNGHIWLKVKFNQLILDKWRQRQHNIKLPTKSKKKK